MKAGAERRLEKLYPALTAKERALHVLQAWKEGKEEDPRVRAAMPYDQIGEFNRLINLMNAANGTLAYLVSIVEANTLQVSLRLGWLQTYQTWALLNSVLRGYFVHETSEPITESEYQKLVAEERESCVSVTQAAETLVDRHTGWSDEDWDGDCITDEAWERLLHEKEKEIRKLAKEKAFRSRRGKDGLEIQAGSFHDWLGVEVVPIPEDGARYERYPDEKAAEVERLRKSRETCLEMLRRGPERFGVMELPEEGPLPVSASDETAQLLVAGIRDALPLRWMELRCLEDARSRIAEEFEGEDPFLQGLAEQVEEIKEFILALQHDTDACVGRVELSEPPEELREEFWRLIELGGELDNKDHHRMSSRPPDECALLTT